jgi:hypothetical protein
MPIEMPLVLKPAAFRFKEKKYTGKYNTFEYIRHKSTWFCMFAAGGM